MKTQLGYSLLEAIATLTAMGIISASAAGALVDLEHAAHTAKIDGAIAAVKSGLTAARAQWYIEGSAAGHSHVVLEGEVVMLQNGWPEEKDIALAAGISCGSYGCFAYHDSIHFTARQQPEPGEACFYYVNGNDTYHISDRLQWDSNSRRCR